MPNNHTVYIMKTAIFRRKKVKGDLTEVFNIMKGFDDIDRGRFLH